MNDQLRRPQAFRLDESESSGQIRPAKNRSGKKARSKIVEMETDEIIGLSLPLVEKRIIKHRFRWGRLLFFALAAIVGLAAVVGVLQLVDSLFARSRVLGWVGTSLAVTAVIAALALLLREILGLVRLRRLGIIHRDAHRALLDRDERSAGRVIQELQTIYRGRADVRLGVDQLESHFRSIVAPEDLIKLAERDILTLLDENAIGLIARAARRVTLLTALTPVAALDIVIVAVINLKMLREMATLYGGRPGSLGTLRLAQMVVGHMAVSGGLALSDNLIQHVIGRGVLGRLSARFGEGAMNGIMTARIGLAAIDLCRPLPFLTRTKPSLGLFVRELLAFEQRGQSLKLDEKSDVSA